MAYPARPLGIAPAVAALIIKGAPAIVADIESAFQGSSYDQTHQQIIRWTNMILADPTTAVSGGYFPINNGEANAANAYLWLNCWAGNQAILATYRAVSGDPAPAGCGCEVSHGCRADAQQALAKINAALNQPAPVESSAPQPSGVTSTPSNGGTLYTPGPGGTTIGLPVSASTITGSSLFGVPILAWGALGLALAFAGGRRGRA